MGGPRPTRDHGHCRPARRHQGLPPGEGATVPRPLRPAQWLSIDDLASLDRLDLGKDGVPREPVQVVDLDRTATTDEATLERAARRLDTPGSPIVGVCRGPWTTPARRLAPRLDLTVTTDADPPVYAVTVDDPDSALARIIGTANDCPRAGASLCHVLRITTRLAVAEALMVESFAYSMLLAGPEFRRWRERTPRRDSPGVSVPVRIVRDGDLLSVTLDHPARRNAYSRAVRDGLVEAFELAAADPTLRTVRLEGTGPAFCSGGDLDEFGTMTDVAAGHLVRLRQGAGAALHRVCERVVVQLHGACIGAGIEIPAFAGRVVAAPDTVIRLPELAMGLIPGAGGTVSLPRRIGRWRTAFLALTGGPVSAATALRWGLVDEVTGGDELTGGGHD